MEQATADPGTPFEAAGSGPLLPDDQQGPAKVGPPTKRPLEQPLQAATYVAGQRDPARWAKVMDLAKRMNVAPEFVDRNFDQISKADAQQQQTGRLDATSPTLRLWLQNPDNATIGQKELAPLQQVDAGARALAPGRPPESGVANASRAMATGFSDLAAIAGQYGALNGLVDPHTAAQFVAAANAKSAALRAQAPDYVKEFQRAVALAGGNLDTAYHSWRTGQPAQTMREIPGVLKDYGSGLLETIGDALSLVKAYASRGAVYQMIEGLPSMAPLLAGGGAGAAVGSLGGPVGATAGTIVGSFGAMAPVNVGQEINQLLQQRGVDITNAASLEAAYRNPTLMAEVKAKADAAGITSAAASSLFMGFGGKLAEAMKGAGVVAQGAGHAADIAMQSAGMAAGQAAGSAAVGEPAKPSDLLSTFVMTLGASAGMEAVGATRRGVFSPNHAEAASQVADHTVAAMTAAHDAQVLTEIGQAVKEAKTTASVPDKIKELIETATGGQDASKIYFQASDWDQHWVAQGASPAKAAADIMGDDGRAYFAAKASGAQLEIPLGQYIEKVAPTEHWDALIPIARTRPDGPSLEEAKQHIESLPATMADLVKEAQQPELPMAHTVQVEQIRTDMEQQLKDAGAAPNVARQQAAQIAAFYHATAIRTGETPERLAARYPVTITKAARAGGTMLEQATHQVATPEFKRYFKGSKVVDESGHPLMVFHGTVNDITAFNKEAAAERGGSSAGADWGEGFYFTNSPHDASLNYGTTAGGDLNYRIDRRVEDLLDQRQHESEEPFPQYGSTDYRAMAERFERQARAELTEHEGAVIPVWLAIKKPFEIGGGKDTQLSYRITRNGTEKGTLVPLLDALRTTTSFTGPPNREIGEILESAMDHDGISASQIMRIVKGEKSVMVPEELRQALEKAGFDGVIDHTVNARFGEGRPFGKPMPGMDQNTAHYIAFHPEQIKSAIGNQGTFDVTDPNILHQAPIGRHEWAAPFYSKLEQVVTQHPGLSKDPAKPMQVSDIRAIIKGAKAEEIQWSGIEDFLAERKSASQAELLAYLSANRLDVGHVYMSQFEGNEREYPEPDWDEIGDRARERMAEWESDWVDRYMDDLDTPGSTVEALEAEDDQPTLYRAEFDDNEIADDYETRAEAERAIEDAEDTWRDESREYAQNNIEEMVGSRVYRQQLERFEEEARDDWENNHEPEEEVEGGLKYANYQLEGPKENEEELLLTLPDVRTNWEEPHYEGVSDEPIFAHTRHNDREDVEGRRIRMIEEAQSKLHQTARTEGYGYRRGTPEYESELARRTTAFETAEKDANTMTETAKPIIEKYNFNPDVQRGLAQTKTVDLRGLSDAMRALFQATHRTVLDRALERLGASDEERRIMGRLLERDELAERRRGELQKFTSGQLPPSAPFKDTWHEFVWKKLIRMAAEAGHTIIAWTTGQQQADRYNLGKVVDRIEYNAEKQQLVALRDGSSVHDKRYDPVELVDALGEDLVKKLLASPGEPDMREWDATETGDGDWRVRDGYGNAIGGYLKADTEEEAMLKAKAEYGPVYALSGLELAVGGRALRSLYDQIFPNYLRKLTKKYGATIADIQIPTADLRIRETDARAIEQDPETLDMFSGEPHGQRTVWQILDLEDGVRTWRGAYPTLESARAKALQRLVARGDVQTVHALHMTPALIEAALKEGFPLYQGEPGSPRGFIKFGENGHTFDIGVLEKADRSTVLHETAHMYTEILRDVAGRSDAPAQLVADHQTLRDWVGATGEEPLTRAQHEQIARGFEAYLMEGKSPSAALRTAFYHFRQWLVALYHQMTALNVQLTPEVRSVFDRMLATDEEIQAAQAEQNTGALFPDPKAIGLSDAQATRYGAALQRAQESATEQLTVKAMASIRRAEGRQWRTWRQPIEREVQSQVQAEPVYRAWSALAKGVLPDGTPIPEGVSVGEKLKLSKDAIVASYGADALAKLPPNVYAVAGGSNPNVIAEMFGFKNGADLVQALGSAEKPSQKIQRLTDQRMELEHGSRADDENLREQANRVLLGQQRAQVLREELRILASRDLPAFAGLINQIAKPIPPDAVVTEQARQIVAGTSVRDLDPKAYERAAARAAKEARASLLAGDVDAAFLAKRKELIATAVAKEAGDAAEFKDKALDDFKQVFRRDEDLAKGRDLDLVNTARAILASYGIGKTDKPPHAYLEAMRRYDPEGYDVAQAAVAAAGSMHGDYQNLSIDDFRALHETVTSLWNSARRNRQIEIEGVKMDRQGVQELLARRIADLSKDEPAKATYARAVSTMDRVQRAIGSFASSLRRAEHWTEAMGPDFLKFLYNPIQEGATRYRVAKKAALEAYGRLVEPLHGAMRGGEIPAPEIGYTFQDKAELLGAMLHTGNESNQRKLLLGSAIDRPAFGKLNEDGSVDATGWNALIHRLQKDGTLGKVQYDFLQAVWDLLETLKPDAQRAHREMFGRYFEEITAKPFTTPFGTYAGGYYPAKVDPFRVSDIAAHQEREELLGSGNSFMFPTTGKGFTKSRVEYNRPLIMDAALVQSHLDAVLRFTHLEPRVRDVARVITSRDFRPDLEAWDPTIVSDLLVPWLQRSAQQRIDVPGTNRWMDAAARELRTRSGMQIMVANAAVLASQVLHFPAVAVKIGAGELTSAAWRYLRQPSRVAADVNAKSDYMATRETTAMMEVKRTIDRIMLDPSKTQVAAEWLRDHGSILMRGVQSGMDHIAWPAAYSEAVSRGMTDTEAVRHADNVVRTTLGSFAPEDVSKWEAGSPTQRLFSMFYGFYNNKANLLGTEFEKTMRSMGLKKGAGRLLYVYTVGFVLPAVLYGGVRQAMSGKPLDQDDDGVGDDLLRLWFGSQVETASKMVPFGGTIGSGISAVINDKKPTFDVLSSPAIKELESAFAGATTAPYDAVAHQMMTHKDISDIFTLLGLITKLPVGPLAKPANYLHDVSTGKAQPTNALDFTRGLLTGQAGKP